MAAFQQDDLTGQTLHGFELHERVGMGGFGAVYRAMQVSIGREVAIKIILPEFANHPDFIRRFEREAHLVARLEHPHIIPLYDYWREPDKAFLVMRWLRGGSLRDQINHGPVPPAQVAVWLDQMASALSAAHRNRVIHRDLKPDNVLLDEIGNTYLADFGIAKDIGSSNNPSDKSPSATLVGSPAYLSPEQIRSEKVSPRTDVYSMGIVLFEMLTGTKPFPGLPAATLLYKHLREPMPSIADRIQGLSEEFDLIISRATEKDPDARYPDIQSLADTFRAAVPELPASISLNKILGVPAIDITTNSTLTMTTEVEIFSNPYKGLRAFQEADSEDFYGREALVNTLLSRMRENTEYSRFLAVVGPSGSGKSSVVKAGLVPALRGGALPRSENWFVVEMFPGINPLRELEAALLSIAVNPTDTMVERLHEHETGLQQVLTRAMPDDDSELLLIVDQFEEIFTQTEDEKLREHFISSLLHAITVKDSRLRVIITLRADFYDRPLQYGELGILMQQRTEVVLPLNNQELENAIAVPAENAGLHVEPELVSQIIYDVGQQPGTLPLLQYALTELYEHRIGNTLSLDAYTRSGGVLGALASRAEALYLTLNDDCKEAARQIFLRLVTLGEGAEDTRRRVPQGWLQNLVVNPDDIDHVLRVYGLHRLFTFDHDPRTRAPTVEVAHEALIRTWERLRGWIDAAREDVRMQRRLLGAVIEWRESNKDPGFLASGGRLVQFESWADESGVALNQDESEYLAQSVAARDAEQLREAERAVRERSLEQRSRRFLQILVGVLLVAFAGALLLTALALGERQSAIAAQQQANRSAETTRSLLWATSASQALSKGDTGLAVALAIAANQVDHVPASAQRQLFEAAYAPGARRRLTGHTGRVWDAAYSPDGKTALSASSDFTLRLWDLATGATLRVFEGHTGFVRTVAFSPDGTLAASGSDNGRIILWDARTGTSVHVFQDNTESGRDRAVNIVVFHPSGQYLLSASTDQTIALWDLETNELVHRFEKHTLQIYDLAFTPDGKQFLSTSEDRTMTLWDLETFEQVREFRANTGEVREIAFLPDGQSFLAATWDRTVRLWDLNTGETFRIFRGHEDVVESVAVNSTGTQALSASDDGTVILWDINTGERLRVFRGHENQVYRVRFSPDDHSALSASADRTLILWDLMPGNIQNTLIGHGGGVSTVAYHPVNNQVLSGSVDKKLILWDAADGTILKTFEGHEFPVNTVGFSPDGSYVISGGCGDRGTFGNCTGGVIIQWDVETGEIVRRFEGHDDLVSSVDFSRDSKYIVSASADRSIILWDAETGEIVRTLTGHDLGVKRVVFTADSSHLLSGGEDGKVILWDVESGELVRTFTGHTGTVNDLALHSDGQRFLSVSVDRRIILWNLSTGRELYTYPAQPNVLTSVMFNPMNTTFVTASQNGEMVLWDLGSAEALVHFQAHSRGITELAFNAQGNGVVSASNDQTLILWRIDPPEGLIAWTQDNRYVRDFSCSDRVQYAIEPLCDAATAAVQNSDFEEE